MHSIAPLSVLSVWLIKKCLSLHELQMKTALRQAEAIVCLNQLIHEASICFNLHLPRQGSPRQSSVTVLSLQVRVVIAVLQVARCNLPLQAF